jgi:hypothetical protein
MVETSDSAYCRSWTASYKAGPLRQFGTIVRGRSKSRHRRSGCSSAAFSFSFIISHFRSTSERLSRGGAAERDNLMSPEPSRPARPFPRLEIFELTTAYQTACYLLNKTCDRSGAQFSPAPLLELQIIRAREGYGFTKPSFFVFCLRIVV